MDRPRDSSILIKEILGWLPRVCIVNAGKATPTSALGFDFPNPLFPPDFIPALHWLLPFPQPRVAKGLLDIGAYEEGAVAGVFACRKTKGHELKESQLKVNRSSVSIHLLDGTGAKTELTLLGCRVKQHINLDLHSK